MKHTLTESYTHPKIQQLHTWDHSPPCVTNVQLEKLPCTIHASAYICATIVIP